MTSDFPAMAASNFGPRISDVDIIRSGGGDKHDPSRGPRPASQFFGDTSGDRAAYAVAGASTTRRYASLIDPSADVGNPPAWNCFKSFIIATTRAMLSGSTMSESASASGPDRLMQPIVLP